MAKVHQRIPDDSELNALLAGVLRRPWDDTARLVYADRLEECGVLSLPNFIRTAVRHRPHACECGGLRGWDSRCAGCRDSGKLSTAMLSGEDWNGAPVSDLYEQHFAEHGNWFLSNRDPGDDWIGGKPEGEADGWAVLHRGFVRTVIGPIDLVWGLLPVLVTKHPVEAVRVYDVRPALAMVDGTIWREWDFRISGCPWRLHDLPQPVWAALRPKRRNADRHGLYRSYPKAMRAMNEAVLRAARAGAGIKVEAKP